MEQIKELSVETCMLCGSEDSKESTIVSDPLPPVLQSETKSESRSETHSEVPPVKKKRIIKKLSATDISESLENEIDPKKKISKKSSQSGQAQQEEDDNERCGINCPDKIKPFGRKKQVPKPEPKQPIDLTTQPPPEDKDATKKRLQAKLKAMRNSRHSTDVRYKVDQVAAANAPPTKKERKQLAKSLKTHGVGPTLAHLGIEDPAIHQIINDSISTGDITKVERVHERLLKYYNEGQIDATPVTPAEEQQ